MLDGNNDLIRQTFQPDQISTRVQSAFLFASGNPERSNWMVVQFKRHNRNCPGRFGQNRAHVLKRLCRNIFLRTI